MRLFSTIILMIACVYGPDCRAETDEYLKTKIAVLDFSIQGAGLDPDMGKIVAEWLITAFVKDGRFDVIERRLLESIINEHKLVMSGVVNPRNAEELGNLLGVKVIITGSIMKFHDVIEANARIIDVQNASIIAAESVKSSDAVKLEDLVKQMADQIISDFPLQGYVVSLAESTVVLDLGNLSGVKRGMKFSVYKEGNVIKHPKTGEVLDIERLQTAIVEITTVRQKTSVAQIMERSDCLEIEYGQRVSSIAAPCDLISTPSSRPFRTTPTKTTSTKTTSTKTTSRSKTAKKSMLDRIASENSTTKVRAIKEVGKRRVVDATTLDAIEAELLKGYEIKVRDGYHVDAMAWCCTILGRSGKEQYRETLDEVAAYAVSPKLQAYAVKGIAYLNRCSR